MFRFFSFVSLVNNLVIVTTDNKLMQGAYKSGKMKFPEFSMFSRPSKQSFPDNYKVKT